MKSAGSARAAWRAARPVPFPGVGLVFFTEPQGKLFDWAAKHLQRHAQRRGL